MLHHVCVMCVRSVFKSIHWLSLVWMCAPRMIHIDLKHERQKLFQTVDSRRFGTTSEWHFARGIHQVPMAADDIYELNWKGTPSQASAFGFALIFYAAGSDLFRRELLEKRMNYVNNTIANVHIICHISWHPPFFTHKLIFSFSFSFFPLSLTLSSYSIRHFYLCFWFFVLLLGTLGVGDGGAPT